MTYDQYLGLEWNRDRASAADYRSVASGVAAFFGFLTNEAADVDADDPRDIAMMVKQSEAMRKMQEKLR